MHFRVPNNHYCPKIVTSEIILRYHHIFNNFEDTSKDPPPFFAKDSSFLQGACIWYFRLTGRGTAKCRLLKPILEYHTHLLKSHDISLRTIGTNQFHAHKCNQLCCKSSPLLYWSAKQKPLVFSFHHPCTKCLKFMKYLHMYFLHQPIGTISFLLSSSTLSIVASLC
jgi:hypothetical protein